VTADLGLRHGTLPPRGSNKARRFISCSFLHVTQLVRLSRRGHDKWPSRWSSRATKSRSTPPGDPPNHSSRPASAARPDWPKCSPAERLGRLFIQPDTLRRWHRELVRRWAHRYQGRPRVPAGHRRLGPAIGEEEPDVGLPKDPRRKLRVSPWAPATGSIRHPGARDRAGRVSRGASFRSRPGPSVRCLAAAGVVGEGDASSTRSGR
jgi:hypothetical protein